ncbi:MAG: hypothetical protein U9N72_08600 [Bacteroidota bacterium]|nr:hypothetical protein [Bacteroidota bacterium]
MKRFNILTLVSLILVSALTIVGCSKKLTSSTSGAGNLEYGFTGNESYSYNQLSQVTQTMVFGGQDINTSVNSELGFTTIGKGIVNGSLMLGITIDTLGVSFSGMGTSMKEDIKDMKGKSFMMTMDTRGENENIEGKQDLTYTIGGMQTSDLKESFMMLFPELPDENIDIGYTWEKTDTVTINTETENAEMIITTHNTVEAREEVAGYDCYKISYTATGTRDGSSQTPQGLVIMNLDINGSGHYYFAIREGIIVSDNTEMKMNGDIVIPTGDSVPMYMTMSTELKIL